MTRIIKEVGRCLVAAPFQILMFWLISLMWTKYVESSGLELLLWSAVIAVFGPLAARIIVWLYDWAAGDKPPAEPEQPRKPEQFNLWEAKP